MCEVVPWKKAIHPVGEADPPSMTDSSALGGWHHPLLHGVPASLFQYTGKPASRYLQAYYQVPVSRLQSIGKPVTKYLQAILHGSCKSNIRYLLVCYEAPPTATRYPQDFYKIPARLLQGTCKPDTWYLQAHCKVPASLLQGTCKPAVRYLQAH